jgi:hypothetical protein
MSHFEGYFEGAKTFCPERSCEAAMGGGAQRPVLRGNEPKKTGARSARRARAAKTY